MVHGILQFTPSIAFCYVLHRCESRDIRCRESLFYLKVGGSLHPAHRDRAHDGSSLVVFLGAFRAGVWLVCGGGMTWWSNPRRARQALRVVDLGHNKHQPPPHLTTSSLVILPCRF
ncbi:hypothetical protein LINPERHAP1_LOCUS41966 [Linum perenne]